LDAAILSIQLERIERRIETISSNPFIDPKDSQRLLQEARLEMRGMIKKYNDLEIG